MHFQHNVNSRTHIGVISTKVQLSPFACIRYLEVIGLRTGE